MGNMEDAMQEAGFQPERGQQHRRGYRRGYPKIDLPEFPNSYFGTDDRDRSYLLPDFVSKKKVGPLARYLGKNAKPNLTTGQIRRFFNHCREIERLLKVDGERWHQVSARFESLCYHAENAVAARKMPKEFQKFIDDNVNRVVNAKERERAYLDGFLPHFEALVGFGAAHMKKDF